MEPKTATLVRFLYPGSFFSEETVKEVKSTEGVLQEAFADKRVFAFQTGTQTSAVAGGETLYGQAKFGPRSYFGEVFTVDELKAQRADRSLISNIEGNYLFAVKTRLGNWQPVDKGDKVYDPKDCRLVLEISVDGRPSRTPSPAPQVK